MSYYEERHFDGVLYSRTSPGGPFRVRHNPFDELMEVVMTQLGITGKLNAYKAIGLHPSHISNMRNGTRPIGAGVVLKIHDITGMDVDEIRRLAGVPKFGKNKGEA